MTYSPLPWSIAGSKIVDAHGELIATVNAAAVGRATARENASLIVRAVNLHEDFLRACKFAARGLEYRHLKGDCSCRGGLDCGFGLVHSAVLDAEIADR